LPLELGTQGSEVDVRLDFAEAFRFLLNRISSFVSLPFSKLDKMSLQKKLNEIGKTKDAIGNLASAT